MPENACPATGAPVAVLPLARAAASDPPFELRPVHEAIARVERGHAAAAPPMSVMNSRRFTASTSRASDRKG